LPEAYAEEDQREQEETAAADDASAKKFNMTDCAY
jgi:hypothetical protein